MRFLLCPPTPITRHDPVPPPAGTLPGSAAGRRETLPPHPRPTPRSDGRPATARRALTRRSTAAVVALALALLQGGWPVAGRAETGEHPRAAPSLADADAAHLSAAAMALRLGQGDRLRFHLDAVSEQERTWEWHFMARHFDVARAILPPDATPALRGAPYALHPLRAEIAFLADDALHRYDLERERWLPPIARLMPERLVDRSAARPTSVGNWQQIAGMTPPSAPPVPAVAGSPSPPPQASSARPGGSSASRVRLGSTSGAPSARPPHVAPRRTATLERGLAYADDGEVLIVCDGDQFLEVRHVGGAFGFIWDASAADYFKETPDAVNHDRGPLAWHASPFSPHFVVEIPGASAKVNVAPRYAPPGQPPPPLYLAYAIAEEGRECARLGSAVFGSSFGVRFDPARDSVQVIVGRSGLAGADPELVLTDHPIDDWHVRGAFLAPLQARRSAAIWATPGTQTVPWPIRAPESPPWGTFHTMHGGPPQRYSNEPLQFTVWTTSAEPCDDPVVWPPHRTYDRRDLGRATQATWVRSAGLVAAADDLGMVRGLRGTDGGEAFRLFLPGGAVERLDVDATGAIVAQTPGGGLWRFHPRDDVPVHAAPRPDGSGTVHPWRSLDLPDGTPALLAVRAWPPHGGIDNSAGVDPFAGVELRCIVTVHDARSRRMLHRLEAETGGWRSPPIAISADGRLFAFRKTYWFRPVAPSHGLPESFGDEWEKVDPFGGARGEEAFAAAAAPDASLLALAIRPEHDGGWFYRPDQQAPSRLRVLRPATGEVLHELPSFHPSRVAFSPDGRWLLGRSNDRLLLMEAVSGDIALDVRHEPGRPQSPSRTYPSGFTRASFDVAEFTPDGTRLAVVERGELWVYDLGARADVSRVPVDLGGGTWFAAAVTPDGRRIVLHDDKLRELRFLDLMTGRETAALTPEPWSTWGGSGIRFSADGRHLSAAGGMVLSLDAARPAAIDGDRGDRGE